MSDRRNASKRSTYVVSLTDPAANNRMLVGGKGANLAQLVSAGMPVPNGFCVTTVAYQRLVDDESTREQIRNLADIDPSDTAALADAEATIRARIDMQLMYVINTVIYNILYRVFITESIKKVIWLLWPQLIDRNMRNKL